MRTCAVTIVNPLGLHARAAARFVHVASGFSSAIRVGRPGREMDGKSIMGLLLLSAAQGTSITISAEGPDEHDALNALSELVTRGFDEAGVDGPPRRPFDSAQGRPCDSAQDEPCG